MGAVLHNFGLSLCTKLLCVSLLFQQALASGIRWIQYTGNDGTVWLNDDRRPALYTGNFGDCMGGSLLNISRFDASYYHDNMTVQFHLEGNSQLTNESLMMYIGVWAYGELRFNLIFNPCSANINSLCPLNSSIPIEATGIIPVSPSDVSNVPPIALTIPDFEGFAVLRFFANSTQSQIGCFSALMTNGHTFSQPAAVGSVLGVFVIIAVISSAATAIYGQTVPETRKHYAHSLSVFVVFSVLQHVFFTGALSVNWPSVLVAFWSNFAWASGMIYSSSMQKTISKFNGNNWGNISSVGGLPSGLDLNNLGGGVQISQIYKRGLLGRSSSGLEALEGAGTTFRSPNFEHTLARRDLASSANGYKWYGHPIQAGLPLPGNYSGFAGTLAKVDIPAANAFMTGFLWLLILIAIVAVSMILLKGVVEILAMVKLLKTKSLATFRRHWLSFTAAIVLRTCFIAFFMMVFLSFFQFTLGGSRNSKALASVVLVIFLLGMLGASGYALYYRLHYAKVGRNMDKSDPSRQSSTGPQNVNDNPDGPHVHDDEDYTRKFGWLASRFRRSKWWFFSAWLVYEVVRAAFYGAAAGHALVQVFGLLAWEILALIAIVYLRPFESNRLNLIMVYVLGFSKVVSVALSSAFDERFNLARIPTTVIGVIIIVIQGFLTIALMVGILLGAISSYMSITRYHEDFRPRRWQGFRERYFAHIEQKATDKPAPPPPAPPPEPENKGPHFGVVEVRRQPKIEDDNPETQIDDFDQVEQARSSVDAGSALYGHNRTSSIHSSVSNLPYGARRHRASWSTRDLQQLVDDSEYQPSGMQSRMSLDDRADSLRSHSRNGPIIPPDMNAIRTRNRRSLSGTYVPPQMAPRMAPIVSEENEISRQNTRNQ